MQMTAVRELFVCLAALRRAELDMSSNSCDDELDAIFGAPVLPSS
jgi:hypothetical protein